MMEVFCLRFCRLEMASAITTLALIFASAGTSEGAPFPSHCTEKETLVFSCKVLSSEKYISLCGSKSLRAPDAYLVYRFGALGQEDFVYPAATVASLRMFKTSHYFRAQVDRRDISFTSSQAIYDVFSYFEGEEPKPRREGGVTVTMAGGKQSSKTLHCTAPYFENLQILDGVVLKGPDYLDDDER